jgi:DNA replication protein DnaC
MMPEQTLTRIRQHLETLKLLGLKKVLDQELARASKEALAPTELVERLLSIEATARIERRIERKNQSPVF